MEISRPIVKKIERGRIEEFLKHIEDNMRSEHQKAALVFVIFKSKRTD